MQSRECYESRSRPGRTGWRDAQARGSWPGCGGDRASLILPPGSCQLQADSHQLSSPRMARIGNPDPPDEVVILMDDKPAVPGVRTGMTIPVRHPPAVLCSPPTDFGPLPSDFPPSLIRASAYAEASADGPARRAGFWVPASVSRPHLSHSPILSSAGSCRPVRLLEQQASAAARCSDWLPRNQFPRPDPLSVPPGEAEKPQD